MSIGEAMTETEESSYEEDPSDTNIIDGTEEELFEELRKIGTYKKMKKNQKIRRAKIIYTLHKKYGLTFSLISEGIDGMIPEGTLASTMKTYIDQPTTGEEKAIKSAEKGISELVGKEAHKLVTSDNELGEWLRTTYGQFASLQSMPIQQFVSEHMYFSLFERPKLEALVDELLGDDLYKTMIMDELVVAATPNYVTVEKMKLIQQMTEICALLQANGIEIPRNLLPAHLRALDEIEDMALYGM